VTTKTFNLCIEDKLELSNTFYLPPLLLFAVALAKRLASWLSGKLEVDLLMGHNIANGRILQALVFWSELSGH
jgi:hypothetical protein